MGTGELSTAVGTVFVVSDRLGNIVPGTSHGIFAADTRHLSRFELMIESDDIVLLRSGTAGRGRTEIYATNSGAGHHPPHSLEIYRRRELTSELQERIELANRGDSEIKLSVTITCSADFADIFEVRADPSVDLDRTVAAWDGDALHFVDRRRARDRATHVQFIPVPETTTRTGARYSIALEPGETWSLEIRIGWAIPAPTTTLPVPILHSEAISASVDDWLASRPELISDDPVLVKSYRQAIDDLATLEIALDSGDRIPAAGLPWYLAIFGRDSIITSLQTLITGRRHACGTLRALAAYQSSDDSAFRDAEPGKIAHEIRFGELALSEAIPHARYYGTIDATPLWLVLLRAAAAWSADQSIVDELLQHAEGALHWIDHFGDVDGDGLIEYRRRTDQGLINQGWKDSHDSIRFADGRLAEGPIALIEAQGYVYAARQAMADIYEGLGRRDDAQRLRAAALELKRRIHDAFWMPDERYYALALDGAKRQVDSITSNPGHLLWSGAIDDQFARQVAERLISPELFSGWGIRTMSDQMKAYNPFSYHNGSVWPHDNSLIVNGLARYGLQKEACTVIDAMLESATHFQQNRLPELFCGYARSRTPFPVDYPVACSPQAWASGSIVLLVQTMAGLSVSDDRLNVDPLPHGRTMRLHGVRFRDKRYSVWCEPSNTAIEEIDR